MVPDFTKSQHRSQDKFPPQLFYILILFSNRCLCFQSGKLPSEFPTNNRLNHWLDKINAPMHESVDRNVQEMYCYW